MPARVARCPGLLTFWTSCLLLVATHASAADPDVAAKFELRDGDRVILLGGTFIERDGQFGFIETALTAAYPDRNITFRNLGWSGDTVWAESRGIFDPAAAGYQRMIELVLELKPTVILLAYGQNESFAGEEGLEAFLKQYEKLCGDLAPAQARLVFALPMSLHYAPVSSAQLARINENIQLYRSAIQAFGASRGAILDFNAGQSTATAASPESREAFAKYYDGMHLNAEGYVLPAHAVCAQLGISPVNFDDPKIVALQAKIVEKNTLFFHRWRPQNITYLFLFRKHEQGNNAVDIPAFDELTAVADKEIAALRSALNE